MATKGKESPSPKENRVTSSHPRKTNTFQQRKSPITSKQASPVKRHDSTASDRHIPNYLKPTISSGLDLSIHQHKKNAPSDGKSNIIRRKSLDKPLLPSPVQKTPTSPSPNERGIRSSSFTTRSATSQKSRPDRLLKSPKDVGKGQTLYGRPVSVKKCNTNIKKQEKGSSATKEQITSTDSNIDDNPDIDVILKLEPHQEDMDASITQVDEELLNVANNNEMETEVLVMEDDGHMNLPQYEVGSHEVEEVKIMESSMTGQDESIVSQIEKPEEILEAGESSKSHSELKEHVDMDNDENVASEATVEDEENGEVKPKEDAEGQEMDKKEEGYEGSTEDVQLQETEIAKDDAKEIKQDVGNEEMKQQVIQGKKDSTVSNDVIEETATKLREQRKNKVKALAGAFETVISLQEPK